MEDTARPPVKRLMIREMVLENFKSYAGVQRVGPFHKVRNCIISVYQSEELELTARSVAPSLSLRSLARTAAANQMSSTLCFSSLVEGQNRFGSPA